MEVLTRTFPTFAATNAASNSGQQISRRASETYNVTNCHQGIQHTIVFFCSHRHHRTLRTALFVLSAYCSAKSTLPTTCSIAKTSAILARQLLDDTVFARMPATAATVYHSRLQLDDFDTRRRMLFCIAIACRR